MTDPRFAIPPNCILLVEVGSSAYGTSLDDGHSDIDQIAIVIETPREVLGLGGAVKNKNVRTQPEGVPSGPGDIDRAVYSLRSFAALAAKGNPNSLEVLYAPTIWTSPIGIEFTGHKYLFRSDRLVPRYRGYMQAQVERIVGTKGSGGHGHRGSGGRAELIEAHGYDTKFAMHAARLGYQCLEIVRHFGLSMPIREPERSWLLAVRRGEVPFDEWFERVLELDGVMGELIGNVGEPQDAAINDLLVRLHQQHWNDW